MKSTDTITILGADALSEEDKSFYMVCVPLLGYSLSTVFNEKMLENLRFKLEIDSTAPDGFGADLQVMVEPADRWRYGLLLMTEKMRPHRSEVDKKLNWQLLQNIFNCYTINLLVIRMRIEGRLEERGGREFWMGEDVTDMDMDSLPYMSIIKDELEEKFTGFLSWAQENMSEIFK